VGTQEKELEPWRGGTYYRGCHNLPASAQSRFAFPHHFLIFLNSLNSDSAIAVFPTVEEQAFLPGLR